MKYLFQLPVKIFLLCSMILSCNDEKTLNNTDDDPAQTQNQTQTQKSICTTADEFKAILTKEKKLGQHDYEKEIDVVFNTFEVGQPEHYENLQDRYATVTDNAYPVTTSFDVIRKIDLGNGIETHRERYVNAKYMFYTVQWSDGLNCVCFGIKNNFALPSEKISS